MGRLPPAAPLLTAALLAVACRTDPPGSAGPTASASAQVTGSAAASGEASRSNVLAADATAIVHRWLAAQNAGDFGAYQALYASRFEGVKRAGPRTRRFGRDGWLTDRRRMFEKKMSVEATDVEVAAGDAGARVRFVQAWSSGEFRDRGPKELVLVHEGGGLKIAREEMLGSKVDKPDLATDAARFAFVLHAAGPRVVLERRVEEAWASGPPRLVSDADPVIVELSVADGKLPPAITAWRDRRVRLFGDAGEVCQASVTGFSLVGRVRPHFGMRAAWRGKPEEAGLEVDGPRPVPYSKAEVAAAGWDLAAGSQLAESGRVLVANLRGEGDCSRARWARDAALDVPTVAPAAPTTPALETSALEAFRKLPAYATIAADYAKHGHPPRAARWEEHAKARPVVRLFRAATGPAFVGVSAEMGGGCADVHGSLFALFEQQGDASSPRWVLVNEPADAAWMPTSAVDVDGDGKVEFIDAEAILRGGGTGWNQRDSLHVPDLDCGC